MVWSLSGQPIRVELESPFSVAECRRRLEGALDSRDWLSRLRYPTGEIVGSVNGARLSVQPAPPMPYAPRVRNSWASVLTADLVASGRGTRLVGRFHNGKFVMVFMWVYVGLALFMAVLAGAGGIAAFIERRDAEALLFSAVPLLFPVFAISLAGVGSRLGRPGRRAILGLLADTCEFRSSDVPRS